MDRLELVAVCADADAECDAPVGQVVERRDLFRQQDWLAFGQYDHTQDELDRVCHRRDRGEGYQWLVEAGRCIQRFSQYVRRGQVVVGPERVKAQLFGALSNPREIRWTDVADRVRDTLAARWQADSKAQAHGQARYSALPRQSDGSAVTLAMHVRQDVLCTTRGA